MKIGFVFQRDSHLKAVQATALRLEAQYDYAQTQFYAIDSDLDDQQMIGLDVIRLSLNNLNWMECNYLVCCLGGYLLNKVITCYRYSDVKVISLFPGVVSHYQLDAFISRFNADQVWLNCPADFDLYSALCQVFGVRNNGFLYGACWVDTSFIQKELVRSNVSIFFEQTQIVNNLGIAHRLKEQLLTLFQSNPNRKYLYKKRDNIVNEHLVSIRKSVNHLPNVCIVDKLTKTELMESDEYLSISSSAIVEGLLLGKKCYLLAEEYLDIDSAEIYKGSGLVLKKENQIVNQNWLERRVFRPCQMVNFSLIEKQESCAFVHRHLMKVYFSILRLCFKYPKIGCLLGSKPRLLTVQKSLEYLG